MICYIVYIKYLLPSPESRAAEGPFSFETSLSTKIAMESITHVDVNTDSPKIRKTNYYKGCIFGFELEN